MEENYTQLSGACADGLSGFISFAILPEEIQLHVLSFLDPKNLATSARCCHEWRRLAHDDSLWRKFCVDECWQPRDDEQSLLVFGWRLFYLHRRFWWTGRVSDVDIHDCSNGMRNIYGFNSDGCDIISIEDLHGFVYPPTIFKLGQDMRKDIPYPLVGRDCPQDEGGILLRRNDHLIQQGIFEAGIVALDGGFAAGAAQSQIEVWSADHKKHVQTLRHNDVNTITSIAINGDMLAAGTISGLVAIFSVSSGDLLQKFKNDRCHGLLDDGLWFAMTSDPGVWCIEFSSDGRHLVTGCDHGWMTIWNADNCCYESRILFQANGSIVGISLSSKMNVIAATARDGTIKIYDYVNKATLCCVTGNASISVFTDGRVFVWMFDENPYRYLIVSDVRTGETLRKVTLCDGVFDALTTRRFTIQPASRTVAYVDSAKYLRIKVFRKCDVINVMGTNVFKYVRMYGNQCQFMPLMTPNKERCSCTS